MAHRFFCRVVLGTIGCACLVAHFSLRAQGVSSLVAQDRLQILPGEQPLRLAEPSKIRLNLHGFGVKSINEGWGYYNDAGYVIISKDDDPPIKFDESTGLVTQVHPGHALIVSSYAGLTDLTCIIVDAEKIFGHDPYNCEDLRPPGVTGTTQPKQTMAPPPVVKIHTNQ